MAMIYIGSVGRALSPEEENDWRARQATGNSAPDLLPVFPLANLWRRFSNEEAAAFDAALQQLPIREKRVFQTAGELVVGGNEYLSLRTILVGLFGEPRTEEILDV